MRPLPAQTIHLPFEPGPFRMAIGLTTTTDAAWFEIDALYQQELAERHRLLATVHDQVFATLPRSDQARRESLDLIAQALTTHHPTWFTRDGATLHNHLTGEAWDIAHPSLDPLEVAVDANLRRRLGRDVQVRAFELDHLAQQLG